MLLSHNTLRSLARSGDVGHTGIGQDLTFYDKYLIKLRDGPENAGPWYHVFGIGYYQMVDDGDYGEYVTAGGLTVTTLAGGWSVAGRPDPLALASAGGTVHLGLSSTEVDQRAGAALPRADHADDRTARPGEVLLQRLGRRHRLAAVRPAPVQDARAASSGPCSELPAAAAGPAARRLPRRDAPGRR